MRIVRKKLYPSREDAVRMTRSEKLSMLMLAYAATVLEDLMTEMPDRLAMVDGGTDRLKKLSEETDELLNDLRLTIPMNQRESLERTAEDYEMRMIPKATPSKTNILMMKEEFRGLIDVARTKCRECTEDDESCTKCDLYNLLTCVLPLDDYHSVLLCPYNLGGWKN